MAFHRANRLLALLLILTVAAVVAAAGLPALATPPALPDLRLVGHIGGATRAVAVYPDGVVFGEGPRLTAALTGSGARLPAAGKSAVFPGIVEGLAVQNQRAFAAAGQHGIWVVNLAGSPNFPTLSHVDTPGFASGLAISGSLALAADGTAGIQVLSISAPLTPTLAATLDTPGYAHSITVRGAAVFAADGPAGLWIGQLQPAGLITQTVSFPLPDDALDVALRAGHVYVAAGGSGVLIVDISDTQHPALAAAYTSPGSVQAIAISGDLAALAGDAGLELLDISTPLSPTLLAAIPMPGAGMEVVFQGSTLWYADAFSGLHAFDIHDPLHPVEIARSVTPSNPVDAVLRQGFAYIADGADGLKIVNVAAPALPAGLAGMDTPGYARALALAGDHAFVADSASGLIAVDLANPMTPTLSGQLDTPGYTLGIAITGTYALLADGLNGLVIASIANPAQITQAASLDTPGNTRELLIEASQAYLADTSSLQVIDISNPAQPAGLAALPVTSSLQTLAITGDTLFGGGPDPLLDIFLISNPAQPTLAAARPITAPVTALSTAGDLLLVADQSARLHLYSLATPANPAALHSIALIEPARRIIVDQDLAYVLEGPAGIFIYSLAPAAAEPFRLFIPSAARFLPTRFGASGFVVDSASAPLAGVTITLNSGQTTQTGADGSYSIIDLTAGQYQITPSKSGYTFSPPNRLVNLPPNAASQDFIASLPACTDRITNGGFENSTAWEIPGSRSPADFTTEVAHSGGRSMRTGITAAMPHRSSYSSARQLVNLPAGSTSALLEFWLYPRSNETQHQLPSLALPIFGLPNAPLAGDVQFVAILDDSNQLLEYLIYQRTNTQAWEYHAFDVSSHIGTPIKVQFTTYNDGLSGYTSLYVDDVSLKVCSP
jgi:hypothetical protein